MKNFSVFAAKLAQFIISDFFLYVTKHQLNSKNRKTKKKWFIGSAPEVKDKESLLYWSLVEWTGNLWQMRN